MKTVHQVKRAQKSYLCDRCGATIAKGTAFSWVEAKIDLIRCAKCDYSPDELLTRAEKKAREAGSATTAVNATETVEARIERLTRELNAALRERESATSETNESDEGSDEADPEVENLSEEKKNELFAAAMKR